MNILLVLDTVFYKPIALVHELFYTLVLRLTNSSLLSLFVLSIILSILAAPIRPWKKWTFPLEKRQVLYLLFQLMCCIITSRWILQTDTANGKLVSMLFFWVCYIAISLILSIAGIGYHPMDLNSRQRKTDRRNIIQMIVCGLYLMVLTGLFIPSEIIKASPEEFVDVHFFQEPTRYLISSFLLAMGAFGFWGYLYGFLLSPKARKHYVFVLTAVSVVFAINYMFFGRDYGIISSVMKYEGAISNPIAQILINLAVLIAVIIILIPVKKKLPIVLTVICVYGFVSLSVISGMNIGNINSTISQTRETAMHQGEEPSFSLDKKGKNIVVIMLDRAISGFVPYIMSEKPEVKEQFDGFVYYPNTLSYGYHTNIAAPALFGGYEYTPDGLKKRIDLSLKEKHNEALKIMPLNFLREGFEVTVCDAPYANYQWIPDLSIYDEYPEIRKYNTIGRFDEYKTETLAELDRIRNRNLFCYSLFRCAPVMLQPLIYDNGMYLETNAAEEVEGFELMGVSADFMNSYTVMQNMPSMTHITDEGKNTFLMLTNEMTHNVIELQEPDYTPRKHPDNTEYEKENQGTRKAEGRKELELFESSGLMKIHYHSDMSAFIKLGQWFDALREQGVYDNTRIIIVSDHGCYLGLSGVNLKDTIPGVSASSQYEVDQWADTTCYNPLLMVKDFGSKGFATDTAFMTNAETPVLAFNGMIESPVNPFTGNPVSSAGRNQDIHRIVESDWAISLNDGNFFTAPLYITFRGTDIFNPDGWSVDGAGAAENTEKP